MPIEYYVGVPAPCVDVKNPDELFEALDLLHTQVLDNFSEKISAPYVELLERAMDRLRGLEEE